PAPTGRRLSSASLVGGPAKFRWPLTGPAGQVFTDGFQDAYQVLAGPSGTYTLTVTGQPGATGAYRFRVSDAPMPPPTPITLNQVVNGNGTAVNQVDRYVFTVDAGQLVFFDTQAGDSGKFAPLLVGPGGAVVLDSRVGIDRDTFPLAAAGEYVMSVRIASATSGAYRFVLWNVPQPVEVPIALDQVVSGTLSPPGEQDLYRFNATA